jgi:hypothetical protein
MESQEFEKRRPSELRSNLGDLAPINADELPLTSRTFPAWKRGKVGNSCQNTCKPLAALGFLALVFNKQCRSFLCGPADPWPRSTWNCLLGLR